MNIRSDLLARLYAIHAFFFAQWRQVPLYNYPTPMSMPQPSAEVINPFAMLEQEDEWSGDVGGDTSGSSGADDSSASYAAASYELPTDYDELETGPGSRAENLSKIIAASRKKLLDLLPEEETDTDEGGGGGTITGLRVEKPKTRVNTSR